LLFEHAFSKLILRAFKRICHCCSFSLINGFVLAWLRYNTLLSLVSGKLFYLIRFGRQ
jgi:hypothetical protein